MKRGTWEWTNERKKEVWRKYRGKIWNKKEEKKSEKRGEKSYRWRGVGSVCINSPGDLSSIPSRVISIIPKWYLILPYLTLTLYGTYQNVKWSNLGKGVTPAPTPVVAIEKAAFGSPLTFVANFTLYIYCHPPTDCFVLSELFSVARQVGRSEPGSKPIQHYARLSLRLLVHLNQGLK